MKIHGHNKRKQRTSEYTIWASMISRCENPNVKCYARYGGKGVRVCDRWKTFENFLQDMGEKPLPNSQLDRLDNDRGYEPDNCRWASPEQQQRNKTNNRLITVGNETKTLVEWCEASGFSHKLIHRRLDRGWTPEKAVSIPPLPSGRPRKEHEDSFRI